MVTPKQHGITCKIVQAGNPFTENFAYASSEEQRKQAEWEDLKFKLLFEYYGRSFYFPTFR